MTNYPAAGDSILRIRPDGESIRGLNALVEFKEARYEKESADVKSGNSNNPENQEVGCS